MDKQIEKLMKNLGITEQEALELIEDDKAIDKGEKLFELTVEQKKAAKAATKADSKPRAQKTQKEKKVDNDKILIMQKLAEALPTDPEIINEEREMLFHFNGKKYKIVLSCPRT